jgi:hypothetical protein
MQAPNEFCTSYARTLIRIKARQLRRHPSFREFELADIEQDLTLYLLSQADHFDPARGSVNTFIDRVVESAAAILARERKRGKRLPAEGIEVESLATVVDQPDGPPAPLAALVSGDDLQRRTGAAPLTDAELFEIIEGVGCAIASLPPGLQQLCRNLMDRSKATSQREMGMSRRAFEETVRVLRQHFASAGLKKN